MTIGIFWPRSHSTDVADVLPPTAATVSGSSFVNQASNANALTMTLPAGLVTGDRLFIAAIATDVAVGATITQNITGWTALTPLADVGTMQRALYTAVYSGSLVAPSWTISALPKNAYVCVAIRNSKTPQEAHTDSGGLSSNAPSIAAAPIGLGLRFYVRKDNLSTSVTPPAGATEIVKALGVATGPSCHVLAYTTAQATAGVMPAADTTWPVTTVNSTAWTISV